MPYFEDIDRFVAELKELTPEQRDNIITDGIALLREFNFESDDLTEGINDNPPGLKASLQMYFYLYLWELKLIDESFIHYVSMVDASDPAKFEETKNKFMNIIQTIPTAIILPVLELYNKKINNLSKKRKRSELTDSPVLLSGEPGIPISSQQFYDGLDKMVSNVKSMIQLDLARKIQDSFDSEKIAFIDKLQSALNIDENNMAAENLIQSLSDQIAENFRDWAENKEQKLDELGRSRIAVLGMQAPSPDQSESEKGEVITFSRSFLPGYTQTKKELLPLLVQSDLAGLIKRERRNPEKTEILTPEQWTDLEYRQNKLFYSYLKGVIERLEHANRWVFAAQQLESINVQKITSSNKNKS